MANKRSYLIAFAFAAAATAWLASGQIAGSAENTPVVSVDAARDQAPLPRVRVARLSASPFARDIRVQGQTQASRKIDVKAQVRGRVVALPVEAGQRVAAGDVIARLDVDDRRATLEQARAQLRQAEIEHEAAQKLGQRGLSSDVKVAEARSRLESARAAVTRAELDLSNTSITAPFAGVLNRRHVELGAYLNAGEQVGTVIDLNPVVVVGQVTERDVGHIEVGQVAQVRTLNGQTSDGVVRYVSASADPNTRTFTVEVEVPNADGRLLEGLTTEIRLPTEPTSAYRITPALLTIADDGRIGVKTVGDDNAVRFHPVEILSQTPDGVWLGGLPDEIDLITVGQEFVTEGTTVEPVSATGDAS